jgi:hypothetical protein
VADEKKRPRDQDAPGAPACKTVCKKEKKDEAKDKKDDGKDKIQDGHDLYKDTSNDSNKDTSKDANDLIVEMHDTKALV